MAYRVVGVAVPSAEVDLVFLHVELVDVGVEVLIVWVTWHTLHSRRRKEGGVQHIIPGTWYTSILIHVIRRTTYKYRFSEPPPPVPVTHSR